MATTTLTDMIDEALERFRTRDLVSGAEVVDFLLDLRLATLEDLPEFPPTEPVHSS